jgi:hypothetical protein
VRDDPGPALRLAPRGRSGDGGREKDGDPAPHRHLRERKPEEGRRHGARSRAEREQRAPGNQQRPRREADERASDRKRDQRCQRGSEDPQLARRGDRHPEVLRDVAQDRRQDEYARLAREQREEEDERGARERFRVGAGHTGTLGYGSVRRDAGDTTFACG